MLQRLLALTICVSSIAGIGFELTTLMQDGMTLPGSLWVLAGYFTILTNGLIALIFGVIAAQGAFVRPRLLGGAVATIVLVGVVYTLLLQGTRILAGSTAIANFLLHQLSPALAPVYWLGFAPKGTLSWRDPLLWTLYPVAYLAYALVRGFGEGHFAYPFIDVFALGWPSVIATSLAIAACFIVGGELMVVIDRMISRRVANEARGSAGSGGNGS